ncbi:MAG: M6 family metalloprotease domain-containing protein [Paludibacteraceae bacterium]|nr:M6 family metalloprotease domain-containing protein [Paludibacteraceae bacterium]
MEAQIRRVPARRDPMLRIQPDGDSLTILLRGDEWKHWTMTLDGYLIRENRHGTLCYIRQTCGDKQKISCRQAHDADKRTKRERKWLNKHGIQQTQIHYCPPRIAPNATGEERQAILRRYAMSAQQQKEAALLSRKIFPKVPVILVNYPNLKFSSTTIRAGIDSMFNARDYVNPFGEHTGSVRQYFHDQSYGKYVPQFDIYGPVTVGQNYSNYTSPRVGSLVAEACSLMNDSLDFSQYDTDGDKQVDLVYVVYAGPPASDEDYINRKWIADPKNLVWPQCSTIDNVGCGSNPRTFDKVTINDYEVSSELDGLFSYNPENMYGDSVPVPAGIGVPCHEFGHGLGLPDGYHTISKANNNFDWDIMDYGCYNGNCCVPAGYTAYQRWFMGWLTPRQLSTNETCSLPPLENDSVAFLICEEGTHNLDGEHPSPASFYLIENRQQIGWDTYLPGHGMLLTKINYDAKKWEKNIPNNSTPLGIDIIEADGVRMQSNKGPKPTDAFPAGATSYKGIAAYPIEDIKETGGVITFRVTGEVPTGENVSQVQTQESGVLVIKEGNIYIQKSNRLYDLLGNCR